MTPLDAQRLLDQALALQKELKVVNDNISKTLLPEYHSRIAGEIAMNIDCANICCNSVVNYLNMVRGLTNGHYDFLIQNY